MNQENRHDICSDYNNYDKTMDLTSYYKEDEQDYNGTAQKSEKVKNFICIIIMVSIMFIVLYFILHSKRYDELEDNIFSPTVEISDIQANSDTEKVFNWISNERQYKEDGIQWVEVAVCDDAEISQEKTNKASLYCMEQSLYEELIGENSNSIKQEHTTVTYALNRPKRLRFPDVINPRLSQTETFNISISFKYSEYDLMFTDKTASQISVITDKERIASLYNHLFVNYKEELGILLRKYENGEFFWFSFNEIEKEVESYLFEEETSIEVIVDFK